LGWGRGDTCGRYCSNFERCIRWKAVQSWRDQVIAEHEFGRLSGAIQALHDIEAAITNVRSMARHEVELDEQTLHNIEQLSPEELDVVITHALKLHHTRTAFFPNGHFNIHPGQPQSRWIEKSESNLMFCRGRCMQRPYEK
jgi:hypothetical protein